MSETVSPAPKAQPTPGADDAPPPAAQPSRWRTAFRQIVHGNLLTSILSVVIALFIGAILIAASNADVQRTMGYFFARPYDGIWYIGNSVGRAYAALFQGAVINFQATSVAAALSPLADTLRQSAPLIIGGLGLGIGFRAGLFNIGGNGQIVLGAILCGYVGFAMPLPIGLHLVVAVLAAILGGLIWGFIPGILRAKTGANEVIVTIMLNSIAASLVAFILRTNGAFQATPGQPRSSVVAPTAQFPSLFGWASADWGFVIAIAVAVFTWWLMERSTLGFRLRAVGENPEAAKTAGINVSNVLMWALVISGGMLGLVAATQLLAASNPLQLSSDIAGTLGFDAITVALLGRSKPLGTVLAGLLFGAFKAGGYIMSATTGTPVDIILILESVIVLLLAAPPLVKAIFRLPDPERRPSKRAVRKAARLAQEAVA